MRWEEQGGKGLGGVELCAVASVCLPFPFAWTSCREFLSFSPPLTFFFFLPCQGSNLEPLLVPDVSSLPQKYSPTFTVFTDYFVCWFTHSFIHPHVCWGGHVYHSMLMEVGGPLHEIILSFYLAMHACILRIEFEPLELLSKHLLLDEPSLGLSLYIPHSCLFLFLNSFLDRVSQCNLAGMELTL